LTKKSDIPARIVHAAVALFSRQGYHGTTTREIARLADVSEVTVFRHFEHKEAIFWSALSASCSAIKLRRDLLEKISECDTPEVVLPQILSHFVDAAIVSPELLRLIAIAFLEVRGKAEEVCREHLAPLFSTITEYLQANIVSGRVRHLDPTILTAAIALTVIAQPELAKVIQGFGLSKLDSRRAIVEYTNFWLGALVPAEQSHSSSLAGYRAVNSNISD
jgi:AcrR family transcriptional regulator